MNKKVNPIIAIVVFILALLGSLLYANLAVEMEDRSFLVRQAAYYIGGGALMIGVVIWQQKKRKKFLEELEKNKKISTNQIGSDGSPVNFPFNGLRTQASVGVGVSYSQGARLSLSNPDILTELIFKPDGELSAKGDTKGGAGIGFFMFLAGAIFFYFFPIKSHFSSIWLSIAAFITVYFYFLSQKLTVTSGGILSEATSLFGNRELRFPRTETVTLRSRYVKKVGHVHEVYLDVVGKSGKKYSFKLFSDPERSVAEAILERITDHLKLSKAS